MLSYVNPLFFFKISKRNVSRATSTFFFLLLLLTLKKQKKQHDVQMDYYSKRIATCSSDRTVKIFSVDDPRQATATLTGTFFLSFLFSTSLRSTSNTNNTQYKQQVTRDRSGKSHGHIRNSVYFLLLARMIRK